MLAKDSATILRTLGVIAIMDPNDESLEQFYMVIYVNRVDDNVNSTVIPALFRKYSYITT